MSKVTEKFTNPIDYNATILAVTINICKHYKEKLDIQAHKMSMEQHHIVLDALTQFCNESVKDCFCNGRKWTSWGDVLLSISDARPLVEEFFEAVKAYKDAKAAGQDTTQQEQVLADVVKRVNLRVKTRNSAVAKLVGRVIPSWLCVTHTANAR